MYLGSTSWVPFFMAFGGAQQTAEYRKKDQTSQKTAVFIRAQTHLWS